MTIRNPFDGGDGKSTDQRVIDLYNNTPTLDWSKYPDSVIDASKKYRDLLERESILAMKRIHFKKNKLCSETKKK